MKRGQTESVEFEISMDLCREKPHEYDAKTKIEKFRISTNLEDISVCPFLRKQDYK